MWWARLLNSIVSILDSGVAAATSAYASIATANGNGSTSTITFSSIPATYTHLQVRILARGTPTGETLILQFNGDTGANYTRHRLTGNGATAAAAGNASTTSITTLGSAGMPALANDYAVSIMDVLDYANTNKYKTARILSGQDENGSGGIEMTSGVWMNSNAITSLTISSLATSFTTASQFALYGIKGA